MTFQFHLLDKTGAVYAASNHIDALMKLMEQRWAGKVVADTGEVLFDIAVDRAADAKMNVKLARAENSLAWERAVKFGFTR